MKLFDNEPVANVLPYDGAVTYYGKLVSATEANQYLDMLLRNTDWKNDEAVIYGKHIVTKRKIAWYGDGGFLYTYSGTTKQAQPWTNDLLALKKLVEEKAGGAYNSCLLNLYHNGDEGMSWHSDDEKSLGRDTAIASVTFGAERKFSFRHKQTKETVSIMLESGSLLVMKGATQTHWLHSVPKMARVTEPRINLTFRSFVEGFTQSAQRGKGA